jgi:hypothetical protein
MIKAIKYTALASALALTAGSAAWAQTSQSYGTQGEFNAVNPSNPSALGQSSSGTISSDTQQKIRQSLEQNGFRNIQVLPEAYVIRAQAPDGSRVAMLLTPDQVTEVVAGNSGPDMSGTGSQSYAGMGGAGSQTYGTTSGSPNGNNNGSTASQQQAQQELSRYGYSNLQNLTPMQGWVANATRNGQNVRIMLSDNGLVATFPGR